MKLDRENARVCVICRLFENEPKIFKERHDISRERRVPIFCDDKNSNLNKNVTNGEEGKILSEFA